MSDNTENMAMVKKLMAQADQIRLGGDLKAGVTIDFVTDFGTEIKGNVIFKRATMADYVKIGAIKSEYLREAGVVNINLVDNSVKFIAHVMATLSVVVVKSPEWLLDIGTVKEPDILYHVFGKYEVWEKSFRKPTTEQVPPSSETTKRTEDVDS